MTRYARMLAFLAALPLAACSSSIDSGPGPGGGDGDDGGGDVGAPDAGGGEQPEACTVEAAYPDLGALTGGNAVVRPQDAAVPDGPQYLTIAVSLGGSGIIDALFLELWDGYGPFAAGGIVPGTYTIAGPDTNLNDCGACVWMAGDLDMGAGTIAQSFMASGGTITLTTVDPTPNTGRLTGSLSNVTLRQVSFEDGTGVQSDVAGGCTTSVAGMSFDATVVAAQ